MNDDAWEGYGTIFDDVPVRRKLPIQSASEFLDSVPEYDEGKDYLGALLHGGYRIHVAGPIGHGKTSFLLEAVGAAVRGRDFLGFAGRAGLRCLYVDLEMPAELLGQAIRDARLEGHPDFDLLNLPHGLCIDSNPDDRAMLEEAAEGYDLLVIDPFYKLVENEMNYDATRDVMGCLDNIRLLNPGLCTIVGFHAHGPAYPEEPLTLEKTVGFKIHHRAVDLMLMFQRVRDDTSWIHWVKNRSPRLRVGHNERWTVEWERGRGFTRQHNAMEHNVAEDET